MPPVTFVGSIPSPENGAVKIGPLSIHMYGVMIAIGVIVAVYLAERRWKARGGDPHVIADIALWLVLGGLVGARLYHVITDYQLFEDDWTKVFRVWQGGLGIWGAVMGGIVALLIVVRIKKLPLVPLMDTLGPTILVAQAIGRFGNYFNQELFGRPTSLPWGLEISPVHRPVGYQQYSTFQPTFLYEATTNLLSFGFIVYLEKRFRLRNLQSFWLYVALNTFFRFFYENMRTDSAHTIGPLRVNAWMSLIICCIAIAGFLWQGRHGKPQARVDDRDDETTGPDRVLSPWRDPTPAAG